MIVRAWRMVREGRVTGAFTGEGARHYGGRWNSQGVAVVYTSEHQSLAALETLVHLQPRGSLRFAVIAVEFAEDLIEQFPATALPSHWRVQPPGAATMEIGNAWVRTARTPVLAVPSVVVPQERNFLLNPLHPEFGRIKVQEPIEFSFDPRLVGEPKVRHQ